MAYSAETAYTTPVGYTTASLPANQATLVGLTVHSPTKVAGVLDAVTATDVTDDDVDFVALLGASGASSPTYILELPDGTIQEITSWTTNVLTTQQSLVPFVTPETTTYKLRKAATIADVFGANNSAGLKSSPTGNVGTYDEVLVLNAAGTAFISCFYYDDGSFTSWYDTSFNDVTNLPLIYADAIYVRRLAGDPVSLVVSGEVKTTPTNLTVLPGNTFASAINPAGTTLGNSGLKDFLVPDDGTVPADFDKVLVQQPNGAYITYNYYNDGSFESWYDASFNDATNVPITSGIVIQSQTATPKSAVINAPSL